MIKPIDTTYKGYKFRSRLEARWAVYFDSLGIKWEYEKEGFEFDTGIKYLPDFWLPDLQLWAEVKPKEFNDKELKKARLLVEETGHELIMLIGIPERIPYAFISKSEDDGKAYIDGEYILSNYHNYPKEENRFYSYPGYEEEINEEWFDDIDKHVGAAKGARFEFKEKE